MKFLVVDDEPFVLQDLTDSIKKIRPEAEIFGFTSAAKALSFAETNDFDAAFLDIELGYTNGIVLAKQLKELRPRIHIIFVTSYEQYAVEAFSVHATGYLLKPADPEAIERELTFLYGDRAGKKNIFVQTFGGFDVFVNGKAILFKRARAKELLAYLISRKGCSTTTREVCAVLFEDVPYDKSQKNYLQTIYAELKNTLKQAGAESILQKSRNNFAVNIDAFDCDYYEFIKGNAEAINQYHGDFLVNYSWAEFMLGSIEGCI